MTFYITALSYFLMMISTREVGEDELNTAEYFGPPISRVLKFQWLTSPFKVVEISYLLDTDPNILQDRMMG